MNRRASDPTGINERLGERSAELCRHLLGEPDVMTAEELRFGNVEIQIGGRHVGKWKIRSDSGALRDEGTDLIGLIMAVNGGGPGAAFRYASAFLARPPAAADGGGP
jgi:hypothetical protein